MSPEKPSMRQDKCEFHKSNVCFLGQVFMAEGVQMDVPKVRTVRDWPPPVPQRELHRFLGFADCYCRFTHNYGTVARHLKFIWTSAAEKPFKGGVFHFSSHPVSSSSVSFVHGGSGSFWWGCRCCSAQEIKDWPKTPSLWLPLTQVFRVFGSQASTHGVVSLAGWSKGVILCVDGPKKSGVHLFSKILEPQKHVGPCYFLDLTSVCLIDQVQWMGCQTPFPGLFPRYFLIILQYLAPPCLLRENHPCSQI